jgi:alpha-L-fucosidase
MAARAAAEMERVGKINRKGRWKATGRSLDAHRCPDWFSDAKFGIFIDWGLWSIASWCPYRENNRMYPDWYERRAYLDYPPGSPFHGYRQYHEKNWGADFRRDHFIDLFRARDFNAAEMARVFKSCGARYVVPFMKHHSGFCLWDSSWTRRDVVDQGPRRDICRELVDACRENGLRFGFYFSLAEWEYPLLRDDGSLEMLVEFTARRPYAPDYETRASGKIAVKDFIRGYSVPQAVEFIDKYEPDLLWYDYDWIDRAVNLGGYEIAAYFYNKFEGVKEVAVNDRYGNGEPDEIAGRFTAERPREWLRTVRGDFYTDELGDTSECLDPDRWHPWECCRGISTAYGNHWQDCAENVLSEKEFVCEFADIVARGGNLLLLVNLDGQGKIPEIQKTRLLGIGKWLSRWGEGIYGTRPLAPYNTPGVGYVRSKDGKTRYAVVKEPAAEVLLECDVPDGARMSVLGEKSPLAWTRRGAGAAVRLPSDYVGAELPFIIEISEGLKK